jgi:hypothetical protein
MKGVDDLFFLLGRNVRIVRQGVKFGLDFPPERRTALQERKLVRLARDKGFEEIARAYRTAMIAAVMIATFTKKI